MSKLAGHLQVLAATVVQRSATRTRVQLAAWIATCLTSQSLHVAVLRLHSVGYSTPWRDTCRAKLKLRKAATRTTGCHVWANLVTRGRLLRLERSCTIAAAT